MSDTNEQMARLRSEIERLREGIKQMEGMPDTQQLLRGQLAQKERELQALEQRGATQGPRAVVDFGSGNKLGNVTIGDVAGRDIIKGRKDD
jgi:hypothetical protein